MATYDLTYQLTNCKMGENSSHKIIVDDSTINRIIIISNYGYIFSKTNMPIFKRYDNNGNPTDFIIHPIEDDINVLSSDKKTISYPVKFSLSSGKTNPPLSLVAVAERDNTVTLRTLNITNNIPGSTVTYEQTSSTKFDITVTCTNGFTGTPQITYEDDYGEMNSHDLTVSGNTATITIKTYNDDVTLSYKDEPKPTVIPVTYDLTNCEVTGEKPTGVAVGTPLNITVAAVENAILKSLQIQYQDDFGEIKTVNGDIDETGKTGTVSYTLTDSKLPEITVAAVAEIEVPPTLKSYGAINVYKVTMENLGDFSKKRFFTATDGTNGIVNLGTYVNRIKRVFVSVPTISNDTLKCGNYDTKINVTVPNTDVVVVNFGNVTLTGTNENLHDYDSEIRLFIPLFGFIDIDSKYINKTVNLTAKVNIITGNGIILLSCDGVPFHFENVSFSRDVLYKTADEKVNLIGGEEWNEQNLYGFEPYFIITSTPSVNPTVNSTNENVTIGDVTGFAQFENMNLNSVELLETEYNEIINQLETGVYL